MAEQIHFNLEEIPRWQVEALCRAIIEAVNAQKDDPEYQARFEKWKKAREQRDRE